MDRNNKERAAIGGPSLSPGTQDRYEGKDATLETTHATGSVYASREDSVPDAP